MEVAAVLPRELPGLEAFAVTLQEARASYLGRDWSAAERGFATLSALDVPFCDTTVLARLYQERIRAFESAPPPRHEFAYESIRIREAAFSHHWRLREHRDVDTNTDVLADFFGVDAEAARSLAETPFLFAD